MDFPVYIELAGLRLHPHRVMELLACVIGVRLFWQRVREATLPKDAVLAVLAGCACGALLGAKVATWLQDPAWSFAAFPDWQRLAEGKSVIGDCWAASRASRRSGGLSGIPDSIGDYFVWPVMLGMGIGRIGCFLAGLADRTAGNPTGLPWGVDFGDGLPRHPAQLYDIVFLAMWAVLLARFGSRLSMPGDRFRAFVIAYLIYRLCIEYLKPMPMVYFGLFSGLQLLCLAGLGYYRRDIARIARELVWVPSRALM